MKLPIILIGSSNTSKTSVGKLLAQQLDLPFISLSDVSEKYFLEIEFNQKQLEEALEKDGGDGYYRYIQPFNAYAIERVLSEHQESVIELAPEREILYMKMIPILLALVNCWLLIKMLYYCYHRQI